MAMLGKVIPRYILSNELTIGRKINSRSASGGYGQYIIDDLSTGIIESSWDKNGDYGEITFEVN